MTERMTWDVRRAQADYMEDAAKYCGLSSRAELLGNALALMKWAAQETRKGRKVCSLTDDGRVETIAIPCLESHP